MKNAVPERLVPGLVLTAAWRMLAVIAVLASVRPVVGQSAPGRETHWIGSWYAAPVARTDAAPAPAQTAAPASAPAAVPAPPPLPPGILAVAPGQVVPGGAQSLLQDRKSTRLNSSHT